ncbi:MAG: O-methyltransferase [Chitinophagales bacterium]
MDQELLDDYLQRYSEKDDAVLVDLMRETHLKVAMPNMLSGPVQGRLLRFFCELLQPKRILELGTFTGYSAICMARGLAPGGTLITIDVNEELEPIASKYIGRAGLADRIQLKYGRAQELIPALDAPFDLVFIDADKQAYPDYLKLVVPLVRSGGWIIADNILWKGKVLQEEKDKDTAALHQYNVEVAQHPELEAIILPLRDGLNLARKR